MRRSFFGTAASQRISDCQNETPTPPVRTFTPQQQMAMLILRKTDLSNAVVNKLMHSTVRASEQDYQFLLDERLAKHNGIRRMLTPMGQFKADEFARELAREYGIPIQSNRTMQPRGSYQRRWHTESWTQ